jgi:predicted RNA-binding protein with PIN domain
VAETTDPHDVQVFYSRAGQTADAIIERLSSKYASRYQITVATNDYLEQQTASAAGAETISAENLLGLLDETERPRRPNKRLNG